MVPTVSSSLSQVTLTPVMTALNWSRTVAENCSVPLTASVATGGVTSMLPMTGPSAVTVTVAFSETLPADAVTVAVPEARAVKRPVSSMVPTVSLSLSQVTVTPVMTALN